MLMLFVALLAIAAGALAPTIAFQVRRDREEEMIHRGVQYSRAIRRYVKKTGRYPSRLEELENTNNIRFLRKRYKDPLTNKDFKVLHVGEVQLTGAAGIAGSRRHSGGLHTWCSGDRCSSHRRRRARWARLDQPLGGAGASRCRREQSNQCSHRSDPRLALGMTPTRTQASPKRARRARAGNHRRSRSGQSGASGDKLSSTVFGGGPIVGVASISKEQSIREFNHKNHYDKWQFIYDPTMDRGGLITTPAQPALQGATALQQNSSSPETNRTWKSIRVRAKSSRKFLRRDAECAACPACATAAIDIRIAELRLAGRRQATVSTWLSVISRLSSLRVHDSSNFDDAYPLTVAVSE